MQPPSERTACAGPRWPSFTRRPAISELASFSSVIGKLESTVRHLGIEVDDALELSEQIEL
jgi:hypothetical protein